MLYVHVYNHYNVTIFAKINNSKKVNFNEMLAMVSYSNPPKPPPPNLSFPGFQAKFISTCNNI